MTESATAAIENDSGVAARPSAVTAAQTLLWVLFAAGLCTFGPYLYTSLFPPEDHVFRLDMVAGTAVLNLAVVSLPLLAFRVGRRGWAARLAAFAVCAASALVFSAYLAPMATDPFYRENGDMAMAGVWLLQFVALPIAAAACLFTPAANRWFRFGA
ncbi:hypothetical protein AB0K52_10240 [Glycomyces sp. NPDC049804]|uniref:hypothetical protein n=1 Tax=Glycomyces sp. NPDC049804 TaxID=3154363 RepID=UPI00343DD542